VRENAALLAAMSTRFRDEGIATHRQTHPQREHLIIELPHRRGCPRGREQPPEPVEAVIREVLRPGILRPCAQ
jgi:hypothetical protein